MLSYLYYIGCKFTKKLQFNQIIVQKLSLFWKLFPVFFGKCCPKGVTWAFLCKGWKHLLKFKTRAFFLEMFGGMTDFSYLCSR